MYRISQAASNTSGQQPRGSCQTQPYIARAQTSTAREQHMAESATRGFVILRTMCAQHVRSQRKSSESTIHNAYARLWTRHTRAHLLPLFSTRTPTLCTQIVHTPMDKTAKVTRHFSASSTAPITTTTISIHI
jgi:hypothetical protein